MIKGTLAHRVEELLAHREPFVHATVVRAVRPTSVRPGDAAVVLADGTIEGFVGGVCAEQSVRLHALRVLETQEALLLRIVPGDAGEPATEGAVTVANPCLSGGAMEIFLEPQVPAPRVAVVGATPIAEALARLGRELDLEIGDAVAEGDLAVVVAAHGRDELDALRAALAAHVPYVGLVASPRRGAAVVEELGAPAGAIETPAGLDIGARTPAEIAVSILARIIQTRRSGTYEPPLVAPKTDSPPAFAVDPICGMTVMAEPGTPHVEHEGETVYFCCEGCKTKFQQEHMDAVAAG
jgi:xanthine dehydrogenase accessory factor